MKSKKLWNIVSGLLFALQILAELAATVTVWRLDVLPAKYFLLFGGAMLLAALVTGLLFFARRKRVKGKYAKARPQKPDTGRRILACVLALLVIVGCGMLANVAYKFLQTMNAVTKPTVVSATVGVYVRAEDPAQTLQDAAGYIFAASLSYDIENSDQAAADIQEELGAPVTIVNYHAVTDMIDALYAGEVDALILNTAYAGILEGNEIYGDFSERTRVLYTVDIEEVQPAAEPGETASQSGGADSNSRPAREPDTITNTPFVVYLSGSDTRSRMLAVSRSDVNILAAVNPSTKQILLINTPRDYFVPNPAGGGINDKLTHCGIYGIDCSIQALSDLYGVPVDYYAQINFTGFETLIDAIGGVTVYSDTAFSAGGYNFYVGDNPMDGAQALVFSRDRYHQASGDNARGQHQMEVIKAIVRKMSSGTTIISRYSEILDSLQGMFITDLSADEISSLVKMQMEDMSGWNVQSYAVTGYGGSDITYSMPGLYCYVMYPNEETVANASSLIQRVMNGETLTAEDVAPIG